RVPEECSEFLRSGAMAKDGLNVLNLFNAAIFRLLRVGNFLRVGDDFAVALASLVKRQPGLNISLGRDAEVGFLAAHVHVVQLLEKGHAPLTPCPRAEALADQR